MFPPFIIVVYESFIFPQSEKIDLKFISHCRTGAKYAEDAGKPKNLRDLEDFSEEQLTIPKHKNSCGSSSLCKLLNIFFYKLYIFIFIKSVNVNIYYVKLLIHESNKWKYHTLWSLLFCYNDRPCIVLLQP